ncbi:MAG: dienelactone hydrolase family protein [Clostridium sp.]
MRIKIVLMLTLILSSLHLEAKEQTVTDYEVKYTYVSIDTGRTLHPIAAKLSIPKILGNQAPPVVIIAHGSGGIDERGSLYSQRLNKAGIATIEIDMWSARNMKGGLSRPKTVYETTPDILDTVNYLNSNDMVDKNRIGLLGFSWGGAMSMLLATEESPTTNSLKSFAANYPVCWAYNTVPIYRFNTLKRNASLLIISGSDDKYDDPNDCKNLVENMDYESQLRTRHIRLNGATHAFDLNKADSEFYDPFAYSGKGGLVPIKYNKHMAEKSLNAVIDFFKLSLYK